MNATDCRRHLAEEAQSLKHRLHRIRPYSVLMPMVPAAGISQDALIGIEKLLDHGKSNLYRKVCHFIAIVKNKDAAVIPLSRLQRMFSLLKMRFNAILDQLDIFSDVLCQRSENETGVWLAGLDRAASDALSLPSINFKAPPLMCYLERGHGAAIRRARTRLPGGDNNPVAVIQIPRERMVGCGIASSLIHEIGHQGVAQLGLLEPLRIKLRHIISSKTGDERFAMVCWERWISEIMADFWAVAKLGVTATHGLIGVLSLPEAFIFRFTLQDPHPFPWIRVKLSVALGRALYPDEQWDRIERLWESLYPVPVKSARISKIISILDTRKDGFVQKILNMRVKELGGSSLYEAFIHPDRSRQSLLKVVRKGTGPSLGLLSPTHALAAIGQARFDRIINADVESRCIENLLIYWSMVNPNLSGEKISVLSQPAERISAETFLQEV